MQDLLISQAKYVDADNTFPMDSILKDQDEAAARLRKSQGLDRHNPQPVVPEGAVVTAPFHIHIVLRTVWPPWLATNREVLAVVPAEAVPGLAERVGLKAEQLYKDTPAKDAPSIVLGPAVVTGHMHNGDVRYGPAAYYLPAEIVKWTKGLSAPREALDLAELRKQAARIELAEARRKAAEGEAARQAERDAEEEARRRNNPLARIAAIEKRLRELGVDT
jgi:hypothetical protein